MKKKPAQKKPVKKDIRERIAAALDDIGDEVVGELLDQILNAERETWTTCPHCNKRVPFRVPDVAARAKAFDLLATQAKGRPREKPHDAGERAISPVSELTLSELEEEEARLLAEHPELRKVDVS